MSYTLPQNIVPQKVLHTILVICEKLQASCWIVGGTVRDMLLGLTPKDLDMTVSISAELFCKSMMRELGEGTLVSLGTENEEACRVVWHGFEVDVSSFRRGAQSIEDDMRLRDFTINSLALPLDKFSWEADEIIDPLYGREDLASRKIQDCPDAFVNDPLRILRGYRMQAKYGFVFAQGVEKRMSLYKELLQQVASERISAELDMILGSSSAAEIFRRMDQVGLLETVLPELVLGKGIEQPGCHHLDVFNHSVTALEKMIDLLDSFLEQSFFAEEEFALVSSSSMRLKLCWAALLHDVGKPSCKGVRESDKRVTFYNHDQAGGRIVEKIAKRLRWSNDRKVVVQSLVCMHMYPFHLCTVLKKGEMSKKVALKLYRRTEDLLCPLFVLAMSDSLASEGVEKTTGMENELKELYKIIEAYYKEDILPVVDGEKLLTGKDLIATFKLPSGPFIGEVLRALQDAQVEGDISTRQEALAWTEEYIKKNQDNGLIG